MFVDSSALVAMVLPEDDAAALTNRLDMERESFTSPIAMFETVLALRRLKHASIAEVVLTTEEFLRQAGVRIIELDSDLYVTALQAHDTYGKGTGHIAKLNMGDCFSYAAAKRLGVGLLYKGDDFKHTDLA